MSIFPTVLTVRTSLNSFKALNKRQKPFGSSAENVKTFLEMLDFDLCFDLRKDAERKLSHSKNHETRQNNMRSLGILDPRNSKFTGLIGHGPRGPSKHQQDQPRELIREECPIRHALKSEPSEEVVTVIGSLILDLCLSLLPQDHLSSVINTKF